MSEILASVSRQTFDRTGDMRRRFIHAADIHLGNQQYGLTKRTNDFTRAYMEMVHYAAETAADFVLIAGDLFHHARADAFTLKQAMAGLEALRSAGIPVIAIEGNHDVQHMTKSLSWMEFLCDQELLVLLNRVQAPNGFTSLVPFDGESRRGSWIDIAGIRIYGLKYYGAATAHLIAEVADDIQRGPNGYTVMMLHAGMEGQVPHMHGGLSMAQLEPLRDAVDYVALGHIHKRLLEDWVFNPGSTEINAIDEMDWPHGFLEVTVDTDAEVKHDVKPVEIEGLRPFRRITAHADGSETLEEFTQVVEAQIDRHRSIPEDAVIELSLGGTCGFRRQDIPQARLTVAIENRFRPLHVKIQNHLVPPGMVATSARDRLSRAELEARVVGQLVNAMAEHRPQSAAWTNLILSVKGMAVERDVPASIADYVRKALDSMRDATPQPASEMTETGRTDPPVAEIPEPAVLVE